MSLTKRILLLAKPYWKRLIGISAAILAISGLKQVEPFVLKQITDTIVNSSQTPQASFVNVLSGLLLSFLGVKLLIVVFNRLSWYLANVFTYRFRAVLREEGFSHLLSLPIKYFNSNQSGHLMSRLDRGTQQITSIINNSGMYFLPNVVTAVIGIFVVTKFNPVIALAMVAAYIPVGFINYKKFTRNQSLEKRENRMFDKQYSHFWEIIGAVELIKSFTAEKFELKQLRKFNKNITKNRLKIEKNHNLFTLSDIFLEIWVWGIYAWIVYLTFSGNFTVGTMVLMLSYVGIIREPLWSLNWIFWEIKRAQIGAKDYFSIMDEKLAVTESANALQLKKSDGHIKFENVTFNYSNGKDVLKDVSFEITPGTTCALVGKSGAGKSTIIALLSRFFEVSKGRILIDGTDIRRVSLKSLRKCIGVVSQEPYLFADTIEENLRYGNPNATHKQIEEACRLANAHEFIEKLPKGYKTRIGEKGVKLSGGQRQRLSIARVILKDPAILIFDEATSQLDSHSEALIQQSLAKLSHNRTTIIIAHRLSTVKRANKIIVFDQGMRLEEGPHDELIKNDKLYSSLFNLQNGINEQPHYNYIQ
ncbi:MAG: ABC transporter ATP-binding protein [Patescibacteria group bacterium]|jgi:ABC-type multidrug transport system fused ATPase/permease subunit